MSDDLIKMEREQHDGLVILRLGGEIDLANVNALQVRLERATYGCDQVVVDLGAVEYIDSQGLRLLQQLSNSLAAREVTLVIVAPPEGIARDVLELTRMGDHIEIRDAFEH
jgi:anti-anti-sigma factor